MLDVHDPQAPAAQLLATLNQTGYLIFPRLLPPAQIAEIRDALQPHLQGQLPGRNDFEGYKSERVYSLLAKSPVFADLIAHPLVCDLSEAVLGANFMISACLAINTHPGETAQALHFDDNFYRVPRPRPAYGVSAFWAIDHFTPENGPTEIIPGSHLWGEEPPVGQVFEQLFMPGHTQAQEHHPGLQQVIMPAGSLMVALGTLWHRGGANHSAASRLAVTPQYCAAWCRQMETMLLAVPPEVVASYSPRVQQLLGYNIHPPFMGHVNGRHPVKTLTPHLKAQHE